MRLCSSLRMLHCLVFNFIDTGGAVVKTQKTVKVVTKELLTNHRVLETLSDEIKNVISEIVAKLPRMFALILSQVLLQHLE